MTPTQKKNVHVTSQRTSKGQWLNRWSTPALLLYLIDVEKVAGRPIEEIDRKTICKRFGLSDSELDQALSSFVESGILNSRPDGKVQFNLDNIGSGLKRQDFVGKVLEEATRRAKSEFTSPHNFFSVDTLSISDNHIQDFILDYQELITAYISKDLDGDGPPKILQTALQLWTVN